MKKILKILPLLPILFTLIFTLLGYRILYIPTKSMEPTIQRGSFALGKRTDIKALKEGDIAVYKDNKKLIVHRIIKIDEKTDAYTFKGDNNKEKDPQVKAESIRYKVIWY